MLIIGFCGKDNSLFSHKIDEDQDKDDPQAIHNFLSKKAKGKRFDQIALVEDEEVFDQFVAGEDYDVDLEDDDSDDDFTPKDDDSDEDDVFDLIDSAD
jgi:hypothetical protein